MTKTKHLKRKHSIYPRLLQRASFKQITKNKRPSSQQQRRRRRTRRIMSRKFRFPLLLQIPKHDLPAQATGNESSSLGIPKLRSDESLKFPPMKIIGKGKDGCIVATYNNVSSSHSPSSQQQNPVNVYKIHMHGVFPKELMCKLKNIEKSIENGNKYYNIEEQVYDNSIIPLNILQECCGKSSLQSVYITSMSYLLPIENTTKLTRVQYRHLRDGIQLLHKNGIVHGDLVDNVMLDPIDNLPRIIDWNNAYVAADDKPLLDTYNQIDTNAFLQFYKVGKVGTET